MTVTPQAPPTAEAALAANGMTGDALLKLAYQAANHYANTHPAFPAGRIEDLAQHCAITVLRRAHRYNPALNSRFDQLLNPRSTPFKSWCWLQMQGATLDYTRKRSEGFAGRLGRDKPINVTPGLDDTHQDPTDDFDDLTAKRAEADHWRAAATRQGKTLEQFVADALNAQAAA